MLIMKNIRIIPRLDVKGPNVVKGIRAEGLRVVGQPRELARQYYITGADEIIYIDIVASLYKRNLDFGLLKSVSKNIFIPLTVGGGIRSIHDINNTLRSGADKVAINTYAIHNPNFIRHAVKTFGSQCITILVEAKKIMENKWEAYTDGGRERTGVDAIEWMKEVIDLGAGEILITSIDNDGTKRGYEMDLVRKVASFASVPIIVHGGAGSMESILKVINGAIINGVSCSSVFHYNDYSVSSLKNYLAEHHIDVRK